MFVHVGHQAVVDASGHPVGYELLFRASGDAASAAVSDGDRATAQVLVTTFLDFGLHGLVGDRLAFVNLPRAFLVGELPLPFPAGQVVLEVLEHVTADAEVVAGVARLREQGHLIALDDVTAERSREDLLHLADYVKIDLQATESAALADLVRRCSGSGRRLIAEKVETAGQRDVCRALGVRLFQGYLTGRPQTLTSHSLTPSQTACLRLLSLLADPDVRTEEVVTALQADASLTVKVLQAANSAAAGLTRRPGSVHEAVVHVGLQTLQAWTVLMGLGSTGAGSEPLTAALARARMCQLLWGSSAYGSWAFLTGLLSGVTDALGISVPDLLSRVPVALPVSVALLDRDGPLGDVLTVALAYEAGRAAPCAVVAPADVRTAFLMARAWSADVGRAVTAA
jgi:EAL and modified HD-GYP domain-containing signal transduction protein